MLLNLQFDPEASRLARKIIFSCESYELRPEDIVKLKENRIVKHVQEENLPERIPCQVLMFRENYKEAKIIFFNPDFILPEKALEDNFLNQDLLRWCKENWWFRLEFIMPLNKKEIKINFSYDTEKIKAI